MQKIVEFLVFVELLNQQYTATSARREEVDKNHFAFIFGLSEGIIQGSFEPILSGCGGDENKKKK